MIVNLSLDQMRAFVEGADRAEITHLDRDGAYALITVAVERVLYLPWALEDPLAPEGRADPRIRGREILRRVEPGIW